MLLEESINHHHQSLNQNELVLLSYIKKNKGFCSQLSIKELGQQCAVSTSFIMRLAQKLGFSGYSELKYQLKSESTLPVESHLSIIDTIQHDLAETFHLMSSEFFANLPELLYQAQAVYTYGSGYGQQTILEEFRRGMSHSNKFVIPLPTSKDVHLNAQYLKAGDIILIVSMSGEVPNIEKDIAEMKSNNVRVISITEFQSNSLAKLASDNLYLQSTPILDTNPQNNYTSYTTLHLLLDTIVKFYIHYQRTLIN